jgi:hypothetical protein
VANPHTHKGRIRRQIAPRQAADLTSAKSGVQHQLDEDPVSRIATRLAQTFYLILSQILWVWPGQPGHLHHRHRFQHSLPTAEVEQGAHDAAVRVQRARREALAFAPVPRSIAGHLQPGQERAQMARLEVGRHYS